MEKGITKEIKSYGEEANIILFQELYLQVTFAKKLKTKNTKTMQWNYHSGFNKTNVSIG